MTILPKSLREPPKHGRSQLDTLRYMIERLIFTAMLIAFFLGLLGWHIWRDRRSARALDLHAHVEAAVRRALGGESFVEIDVLLAVVGRRGQVVLSVPPGWGWLVKAAWDDAVAALPAGYDLVVRGASSTSPRMALIKEKGWREQVS